VVRGLGHGWYGLRRISAALWLAGLKLILPAIETGGASRAAELLREHILKFQERYIREWNEYKRATNARKRKTDPTKNRNKSHR
jgi:hypothetical protein